MAGYAIELNQVNMPDSDAEQNKKSFRWCKAEYPQRRICFTSRFTGCGKTTLLRIIADSKSRVLNGAHSKMESKKYLPLGEW